MLYYQYYLLTLLSITILLEFARKTCDEFENIDFVFADIHGNLKVKFTVPVKNKLFANFTDELELAQIIASLDDLGPVDNDDLVNETEIDVVETQTANQTETDD